MYLIKYFDESTFTLCQQLSKCVQILNLFSASFFNNLFHIQKIPPVVISRQFLSHANSVDNDNKRERVSVCV